MMRHHELRERRAAAEARLMASIKASVPGGRWITSTAMVGKLHYTVTYVNSMSIVS